MASQCIRWLLCETGCWVYVHLPGSGPSWFLQIVRNAGGGLKQLLLSGQTFAKKRYESQTPVVCYALTDAEHPTFLLVCIFVLWIYLLGFGEWSLTRRCPCHIMGFTAMNLSQQHHRLEINYMKRLEVLNVGVTLCNTMDLTC